MNDAIIDPAKPETGLLQRRQAWEKQVGLRYFDAFRPFPDVIEAETPVLDSWLHSMEIRPNPRPGKCGFWYSPDAFQLKRKVISDSRLIYLQQGCGRARVGDSAPYQRFCAGDALLVPPSVHHDFIGDPDTPLLFFAIHFDIRLLGGVNPLNLIGFPRFLAGSDHTPYGAAAWRIAREFSTRPPGWELAIAAELQSILLYLLRFQGKLCRPLHDRGRGRQILRLLPALELVDRRLNDPSLRVAELASEIAVSEVYLRRLCGDVMGLSPTAFLQRRRIERAGLLLQDPARTLERVAAMSGFANMSHFHRTFKRWTTMTPSQFRADEIGT